MSMTHFFVSVYFSIPYALLVLQCLFCINGLFALKFQLCILQFDFFSLLYISILPIVFIKRSVYVAEYGYRSSTAR